MQHDTASVRVERATPADDVARDALVRIALGGSLFHLSGWRRAVEAVFGHPFRDLVALRGDELVGVLPLGLCPGMSGRRNLLSVPYGVCGGPAAEDEGVRSALVDAAIALADEESVGRLELRCQRDGPASMVANDLYWSFERELPDTPEDVLARMPKKARAEARKARTKHGLELSRGAWYVDDLVRLFHLNKQGLGSPGLPADWFHALRDELGDDVHVHLVRQAGRPLAATMSFGFGGTLVAYYSGAQPGADRTHSVSNFLYMALQEWAVRAGFDRFDFGRSRRDTGAFRFKEHQGFEAVPMDYRYHLVRDRGMPSFTPSNPRTRVLQELWSRLPHPLARWMSDRLAPRLA